MKECTVEKTKVRWHGKRMHGQLPCNLDVKLVDIEQSYRWLKSGDNKGQTESTIVAAQDQAIIIIIIIIIIIFIYCNCVVTRWQWLFYISNKT